LIISFHREFISIFADIKTAIMERCYRIDEGHYFSEEDWSFFAKWEINQLLKDGWSIKAIKEFEDNEVWCFLCEKI